MEDSKNLIVRKIKMRYQGPVRTIEIWDPEFIKENMSNNSLTDDGDGWIKPFMRARIDKACGILSAKNIKIRDGVVLKGFLYVRHIDRETMKPFYGVAIFKNPIVIGKPCAPNTSTTFEVKITDDNIITYKDFINSTVNQCGDLISRNEFNDIISGYIDFNKCEIEYETRRCKDKNKSYSVLENKQNYSAIVGLLIGGEIEFELIGSTENEKIPENQIWSSWDLSDDTEGLDLQILKLERKIESLEPGALLEQCKLRLEHLKLLKMGWKKEWKKQQHEWVLNEEDDKTKLESQKGLNELFENQVLPSWTYNLFFNDELKESNRELNKNIDEFLDDISSKNCGEDISDSIHFDDDIENYKKYKYYVPDFLWYAYLSISNEMKFFNLALNKIAFKLLDKIGGYDKIEDKYEKRIFLSIVYNGWLRRKFDKFFYFYKTKCGDNPSLFKHFINFIINDKEWKNGVIVNKSKKSLIYGMNFKEFNKLYQRIVENEFLELNDLFEKGSEKMKHKQFFIYENFIKNAKKSDSLRKDVDDLKSFFDKNETIEILKPKEKLPNSPIKMIDELASIFFEKIEKRFFSEVDVDLLPKSSVFVIDSQLLKTELTTFLTDFFYNPETEESNDGKDFFDEFMKHLKTEGIQDGIKNMMQECVGVDKAELYMKILSEEIDNFMNVYNKVAERHQLNDEVDDFISDESEDEDESDEKESN